MSQSVEEANLYVKQIRDGYQRELEADERERMKTGGILNKKVSFKQLFTK